MRSSVSLSLMTISVVVLAFAGDRIATAVRAQSIPVQQAQTPEQADQARELDRRRAEDMKIGPDWRAHEGAHNQAGPTGADKDHQTVGQDWRVHPGNRDH